MRHKLREAATTDNAELARAVAQQIATLERLVPAFDQTQDQDEHQRAHEREHDEEEAQCVMVVVVGGGSVVAIVRMRVGGCRCNEAKASRPSVAAAAFQ